MAAQQELKRNQSAAGTFTLDDVRDALREREQRVLTAGTHDAADQCPAGDGQKGKKGKDRAKQSKNADHVNPQRRSAASVVDILGFNPDASAEEPVPYERSAVRKEWLDYYDALVAMRCELQARIAAHQAETFRGDEGDQAERLRVLGQHTADGAADHADLERALTFVENERELLDEVVGAIGRIFSGTYGICAQTGKQIDGKRLSAIPFARFSLDGQREIEEMRKRSAPQRSGSAALFVAGDGDGDSLIGGGDDGED
jgi:RNA polymerase-binding transcription factor DksA